MIFNINTFCAEEQQSQNHSQEASTEQIFEEEKILDESKNHSLRSLGEMEFFEKFENEDGDLKNIKHNYLQMGLFFVSFISFFSMIIPYGFDGFTVTLAIIIIPYILTGGFHCILFRHRQIKNNSIIPLNFIFIPIFIFIFYSMSVNNIVFFVLMGFCLLQSIIIMIINFWGFLSFPVFVSVFVGVMDINFIILLICDVLERPITIDNYIQNALIIFITQAISLFLIKLCSGGIAIGDNPIIVS